MNHSQLKVCLFSLSVLSCSLYAEVAVIVSAANQQAISDAEIKNLFTGKQKSFPDGNPAIVLTLLGGDPKQSEFNQKALGRTDAQLKAYWSKVMFTGKGNPPKEVSAEEMLKLVADNPSTIGVIDLSQVNNNVRVIAKY